MMTGRHSRNNHNGRQAELPGLIAHRGLPARFPENTLIGFEHAVAAGAVFLELDVQLSADGVPVLYHDRTLARISGREGAVHEYSAAQLARFRAFDFARFGYRFAQTPVARLAEFVRFLGNHPQVTAFVEIKRISVDQFGAQKVVGAVLEELQPVVGQCVVISYSAEALAAVRDGFRSAIGAVIDHWRERKLASFERLRPEYWFCRINGLPARGRLVVESGQLAVFETGDARLVRKLARRGVSFVETDTFIELQRELLDGVV